MHKKPADQNEKSDIDPGLLNRIMNTIGRSKHGFMDKPAKHRQRSKDGCGHAKCCGQEKAQKEYIISIQKVKFHEGKGESMNRTRSKAIRKIAETEGINYRRLKKDMKATAFWLSTIPKKIAIFSKKQKPGEGISEFKARRKATNKRKRLKRLARLPAVLTIIK